MWGFVMAGEGIDYLQNDTSRNINKRIISHLSKYQILKHTRFLNKDLIPQLFIFPKDMQKEPTEINHLSNQKLVDYYLKSADNWR